MHIEARVLMLSRTCECSTKAFALTNWQGALRKPTLQRSVAGNLKLRVVLQRPFLEISQIRSCVGMRMEKMFFRLYFQIMQLLLNRGPELSWQLDFRDLVITIQLGKGF